MRKFVILGLGLMCAAVSFAGRNGPWTKERAWEWYDAQPWIRGCNYMPASAANRVDQWQALGSEERFAEVERELAAAEALGFNTMRLLVEWCGFGVWLADPDGFMERFERYLSILDRHHMRAIVVLGNDCSRPKRVWKLPAPGPQPCDWGYHGGRKASQHGSFPDEIGYTPADDPVLAPKFDLLCETLMTKYRDDKRILFWNVWNEPGNNGRGQASVAPLRRVFEIGWRTGVVQPLAADVWMDRPDPANEAERTAGELSDIVSYHCYGDIEMQKARFEALKKRFGRPAINTEWLARTLHNDVFSAYPFFAQNRIGCTMWGLVAGKYQTYEPWEHMWNDIVRGKGDDYDMSKWFHDLLRPSLRPYDPRETNVIRRINSQMDAERQVEGSRLKVGEGGSVRMVIARRHRITGEDLWYGYRRTKFDFDGRTAWIVEPSVAPLTGCPWTWTMQWAEAFVDRTGVPDLLKRGFHHVTIDLFDTRMDETGLKTAAEFQKFLTEELGLAPKANLVGMSWGGFFSVRYAAAHPENVAKIYLDAPLLNFHNFRDRPPEMVAKDIGDWAKSIPVGGWTDDPRMPVNMASKLAAAKIPVLLVYGGADRVVPPESNCEIFIPRFKAAGGEIEVVKRGAFGHHPHGLDPDKTRPIVDFLTRIPLKAFGREVTVTERTGAVIRRAIDTVSAAGVGATPRMRIAFQVYGVRELCERDLVGTLGALKAMGYEGVETGRFYGRSAAEWRRLCAEVGLELVALQLYPHNLTEPQLAKTILFCRESGCRRINVAWYRGSAANPNDWQLLVNVLNHAAEVCAHDGIAVGYHNHDHEFRDQIGDRCVWDWLWLPGGDTDLRQVSETPRFSERVVQELDCGNCVLGGGDPIRWVDRIPGRNPTVHLMPAIADPSGLKPGEAGLGGARDRADWPRILPALRRAGTEWLVVKPTAHPNDLADMKASIDYLKGLEK